MGSKKIFLMRSLKRVAALASVLSVVGGLSVGSVSAQVTQYQSINQQMQSQNYAPIPTANSARIISGQSNYRSQAAQQATVNRRALIGHGRMISAGYRQDSGTSGTDSPKPDRTVLQTRRRCARFFRGRSTSANGTLEMTLRRSRCRKLRILNSVKMANYHPIFSRTLSKMKNAPNQTIIP